MPCFPDLDEPLDLASIASSSLLYSSSSLYNLPSNSHHPKMENRFLILPFLLPITGVTPCIRGTRNMTNVLNVGKYGLSASKSMNNPPFASCMQRKPRHAHTVEIQTQTRYRNRHYCAFSCCSVGNTLMKWYPCQTPHIMDAHTNADTYTYVVTLLWATWMKAGGSQLYLPAFILAILLNRKVSPHEHNRLIEHFERSLLVFRVHLPAMVQFTLKHRANRCSPQPGTSRLKCESLYQPGYQHEAKKKRCNRQIALNIRCLAVL